MKSVIVTYYKDGRVAITNIVNTKLDIISFMEKTETIETVHSCQEMDVTSLKVLFPDGAINADRLTHVDGQLVYAPDRLNKQELKDVQKTRLKEKLMAQGYTKAEAELLVP